MQTAPAPLLYRGYIRAVYDGISPSAVFPLHPVWQRPHQFCSGQESEKPEFFQCPCAVYPLSQLRYGANLSFFLQIVNNL